MMCPRCQGRGELPILGPAPVPVYRLGGPVVVGWKPCDYPGCHGGHLHCCEGDQA